MEGAGDSSSAVCPARWKVEEECVEVIPELVIEKHEELWDLGLEVLPSVLRYHCLDDDLDACESVGAD